MLTTYILKQTKKDFKNYLYHKSEGLIIRFVRVLQKGNVRIYKL